MREKVSAAKWSKLVRERDGNRCAVCGSTEKIEAHHIEGKAEAPGKARDIRNGIALCRKCHRAAHGGSFNKAGGAMYPLEADPEEVSRVIREYIDTK